MKSTHTAVDEEGEEDIGVEHVVANREEANVPEIRMFDDLDLKMIKREELLSVWKWPSPCWLIGNKCQLRIERVLTIEIEEIVANEHEENSEGGETALIGFNAVEIEIRDDNETVEHNG